MKDTLTTIEKQIIEVIETKIRPGLNLDGGDIDFKDFKDGIVTIILKGACSGCPSANATLKGYIETTLKHFIPEVKSVVEDFESW